jgi:hypothetical protein
VRRSLAFTPGDTFQRFAVIANAGSIVYFTLNQLEEGSFVTSPIVTAGASATRAADIPQLTGAALTGALNAKAAFFQTTGVEGTTGSNSLLLFSSAGQIIYGSSTLARITPNGVNFADALFGTGNYTGIVKTAFGFDAAGMTAIANNSTKGTNATSFAASGTPYLGNRSAGDRALNGYMQRFALSLTKGQFDGLTV